MPLCVIRMDVRVMSQEWNHLVLYNLHLLLPCYLYKADCRISILIPTSNLEWNFTTWVYSTIVGGWQEQRHILKQSWSLDGPGLVWGVSMTGVDIVPAGDIATLLYKTSGQHSLDIPIVYILRLDMYSQSAWPPTAVCNSLVSVEWESDRLTLPY